MGQAYEFICPNCQYSAGVSGGKDVGFEAVVVTVVCRDCQALYDAVADQKANEVFDGERIRGKLTGLKCPENASHDIIQWRHTWACPKCGERMERSGNALCWD